MTATAATPSTTTLNTTGKSTLYVASNGVCVEQASWDRFDVWSNSAHVFSPADYTAHFEEHGWACTCLGYLYTIRCKHLAAVLECLQASTLAYVAAHDLYDHDPTATHSEIAEVFADASTEVVTDLAPSGRQVEVGGALVDMFERAARLGFPQSKRAVQKAERRLRAG